jgi:hypothetical protein
MDRCGYGYSAAESALKKFLGDGARGLRGGPPSVLTQLHTFPEDGRDCDELAAIDVVNGYSIIIGKKIFHLTRVAVATAG